MSAEARIAIVGDVHLVWDDRDVALLDRERYDLVLFVGDFAGYGADGALRVARSVAQLETPALVMPGNHDGVTVPQLGSEVFDWPEWSRWLTAFGMQRRVDMLARALGPVPLCGYSAHPFPALGVTVVAGRPHSIGGPRLGFRRYLKQRFGVASMDESAARLGEAFARVPAGEPIIVLAHCGPAGLGASRDAMFGCDFRPEAGDWGDEDLRIAIAHARSRGKRVIAVVAGHMHHRLRGGGERSWQLQRDGICYVNAARVSRARKQRSERHHVLLRVTRDSCQAEAVWLS